MDFNFLKQVQKAHAEGEHELRRLERGQTMTSKRKLEAAKRQRGLARARERGADVQKLPHWMERSKINQTRWDAKYIWFGYHKTDFRMQCVLWTVEWIVIMDGETKTTLDHR
jgi:hypothetical protein